MSRLYVPLEIYPKRHHLFPLLKPFEKGEIFSDADRVKLYGISEKEITFVTSIETADYVILPMSWNFYISKNKIEDIRKVVQEAKTHTKIILSFMVGDFGVNIPHFENVIVFRHSGDSIKLPKTHLGLPTFVEDPLPNYFNTTSITLRDYHKKPTVGFCGQANGSLENASVEILKTIGRNSKSALGMSQAPPQQVLSTSYFRASLLETLEKDEHITTNFILRKKYRAGATTAETRQKTTLEFYKNIQDSDYVVCARGAGNFSVRFYETLAMGRIPVFIDTHCLLPLANSINWKKHVVWVNYADRNNVAEKVETFHKNLTSKQFQDLQHQNRTLWQEHLTLRGFFKTYFNSMLS